MDEDGDESDMEIESVGVELNERLRAAAALREAGNATTVMDEEWEQWLKEAAESGGIPFLAQQTFPWSNNATPGQSSTGTTIPPRLLNAARLGQWHQIPDFLHNMVRQNIEARNLASGSASPAPHHEVPISTSSQHSTRTVSATAPLNIHQRQPTTPRLVPRRISHAQPVQPSVGAASMLISFQPRPQSTQPPLS